MALMPLRRVVRKSVPPGLPNCEARYRSHTNTMDLELAYVNIHVGMMRHSPDKGKHHDLPTQSQTTPAVTAASAVLPVTVCLFRASGALAIPCGEYTEPPTSRPHQLVSIAIQKGQVRLDLKPRHTLRWHENVQANASHWGCTHSVRDLDTHLFASLAPAAHSHGSVSS